MTRKTLYYLFISLLFSACFTTLFAQEAVAKAENTEETGLSAGTAINFFPKIIVVDGSAIGTSLADFDNDGLMDIYVFTANNQSNFLLRNTTSSPGTFTWDEVTSGAIVTDDNKTRAASWGDYDNDGDLDLFTVDRDDGLQNYLYRNTDPSANPSFTQVGFPKNGIQSEGCSWADYDNDGDLDMVISNDDGDDAIVLENDGSGVLSSRSLGDLTGSGGISRALSWADFDNDGDVDIFIANESGKSLLLENRLIPTGTVDFFDVSNLLPDVSSNDAEGGSWGDYDNDGDLDLFVTFFNGQDNVLFENLLEQGSSAFTDIMFSDGEPSYGGAWGDFDNDGDLDLYVGNDNDGSGNNIFYENDGSSPPWLPSNVGNPPVDDNAESRGLATADFDSDGHLDIFIANVGPSGDRDNFMYLNQGGSNNSIRIMLEGTTSNRSGIGARVEVWDNGNRQIREITAQTGYGAQSSLWAHFGVGSATVLDSIIVRWPSSPAQTLTNVSWDPTTPYLIVESDVSPDIAVDPSSYNFGDVQINQTSDHIFTVTNDGDANLHISNSIFVGTNSGLYSIINGFSPPVNLDPAQSAEIEVRFAPTTTGQKNVILRLNSNDPDEDPLNIIITGEGIPIPVPDIQISETFIDFGSADTSSFVNETLNIGNVGTAPLTLNAIQISDNPSEFSVIGFSPPVTIPSGDNIDVTLRFSPDLLGTRTGKVQILSNDPDEGTVTVDLQGTGLEVPQPDIAILPSSYNFGTEFVGNLDSTNFTIKNLGNADLNLTTVQLIGANVSEFSTNLGSFLPAQLSAGDSAEFKAGFLPTSLGTKSASIRITSNDPDEAITDVLLSGNSIAVPVPELTTKPDPPLLAFGQVFIGDTLDLPLVLLNSGTATLTVTDLVLSHTDRGYRFNSETFPITIPAGDSSIVTVSFEPLQAGFSTTALTVSSDDPNSPSLPVTLEATGTSVPVANIDVDPTSHNYGSVRLGTAGTRTFRVTNVGTADLTVSPLTITGSHPLDFIINNAAGFTLTPSQFRDIVVDFEPTALAGRTGNLRIPSNDLGTPVTLVPLGGLGTLPQISVNRDTLNFGQIQVGSSLQTLNLQLQNTGTSVLTVDSLTLANSNPAYFDTLSFNGPQLIQPDSTLLLGINFLPAAIGDWRGTLSVWSDDTIMPPPIDVALIAEVVAEPVPNISASLDSISFGEMVIVNSQINRSVTVRNIGSDTLFISGISTLAPDGNRFNIISGADADTLLPSAAQIISIDFIPDIAREYSSQLQILSDDPDMNDLRVILQGTAIEEPAPVLGISADTLNFGTRQIGSTAPLRVLKVFNTGNLELDISDVTVTPNETFFEIVSGGGSFQIVPGDSQEITVRFITENGPDGSKQATLNIVSTDVTIGTVEVLLEGILSLEGGLVLNRDILQFNQVGIDSLAELSVNMDNAGISPLTIALQLDPDATGIYVVSPQNFMLDGGEDQQVTIGFRPTELGSYNSFVDVYVDGNLEETVNLRGEGKLRSGVWLKVQPDTSLVFDTTPVGKSKTQQLMVRNVGLEDAQLDTLVVSGSGNSQFLPPVISTDARVIPSNETKQYAIVFQPQEPGPATGQVTAQSNDPRGALSLDLSGVANLEAIRIAPDSIFISVPPTEGQAATIETGVGGSVRDVFLFYRTGTDFISSGEKAITDSIPMNLQNGRYRIDIDAAAITATGLQYKIRARNATSSDSLDFRDLKIGISNFSAVQDESNFPFGIPQGGWQAIAIPFAFNGSISLSNLLGAQETVGGKPVNWGAYEVDDNGNINPVLNLQDGNGYWLYHTEAQNVFLPISSAQTNDLDSFGEQELSNGWNLIPWTYSFTGYLSYKPGAEQLINSVWTQFNSENERIADQLGVQQAKVLRPYSSYFVFVEQGPVFVKELFDISLTQPTVKSTAKSSSISTPVYLDLTLHAASYTDRYNTLATTPAAQNGFDTYDEFEPPSLAERMRMFFYDPEDEAAKALSADVKFANDEGNVWHMRVEAPRAVREEVTLHWNIDHLPENFQIRLIDMISKKSYELKGVDALSNYAFYPVEKHGLKLIVGTPEFIDQAEHEIRSMLPDQFQLSQNYPNPFNPTTRFDIAVATSGDVEVAVYNVLGQRIARLQQGFLSPGRYTYEWKGETASGVPAASGIYFIRMTATNYKRTIKAMLLR
ncbi:MAG: choice-of-anchor D domain-containing protein [Calditrichia bacterium]